MSSTSARDIDHVMELTSIKRKKRETRARCTFVIGSDEAQDVVVPQHHRLVDLGLAEPGSLLPRAEDLHGDVLATPTTAPNLAKATFADRLHQLDLARYAPLYQKRQAYLREDGH